MSAADRIKSAQQSDPDPAPSDPATDEVSLPQPVSASSSETAEQRSRFVKMREHFAKQKKVRVRLENSTMVQVNGYTFAIKGKTGVEVPEQIADMLVEAGLA